MMAKEEFAKSNQQESNKNKNDHKENRAMDNENTREKKIEVQEEEEEQEESSGTGDQNIENQAPGENRDSGDEEKAAGQTEHESTEQEAEDAESQAAPAGADEPEAETGEQEAGEDETISNEEVLQEKIEELKDKYLRLSAEFDNYRKRTLKEKSELIRSAGEDVLSGFLPVMDDIDRAYENIDRAADIDSMKQGVTLIRTKLKEFLKQNGIAEIEALNQEFNTDEHEAVSKIPAPEEGMKGKVIDVIEKGYYLNDKILRYAKVVVGE